MLALVNFTLILFKLHFIVCDTFYLPSSLFLSLYLIDISSVEEREPMLSVTGYRWMELCDFCPRSCLVFLPGLQILKKRLPTKQNTKAVTTELLQFYFTSSFQKS